MLRSLVDSPADLASTIHAVLGNAVRLANTDSGFIYLEDGDVYRHGSDVGATVEVVEFNKANPIRPTEQAALATVTSQLAASVEHQRIELARFLPQQVADLISSPDGQKLLEGHRSEITVVFVDIRGFTEFSAG